MKNNKIFNNILNECLERILKGETIEQCLERYPEQANDLEPLLRTALATKMVSAIQPRPEFKTRARLQFRVALNEAFRQPEARGVRWHFVWHSAWATALSAVAVIVLVAGSTVAAAGNSMPDQPLYPVKLATEKIREMATPSALSKAELHAELADRRVVELVYLADSNNSEKLELTAQRLNAHLATIANLVEVKRDRMVGTGAFSQSDVTREKSTATSALTPKPTPAIAPAPAPAPTPVPAPKAAASPRPAPSPTPVPKPTPPTTARVVPTPIPGPAVKTTPAVPLSVDREKLKRVVERYAVNQSTRLNEALKKAPIKVRPALRKALEESVAGYEKAINKIEAKDVD